MKRFLLTTIIILTGFSTPLAINTGKVTGGEEEVKASYYGKKFHGKKTASGDLFDMNEHTAAHRTLPFGTKVKVTNTRNGKEVIVTINDRGPFSKHRKLDLSRAAFDEIANLDSGVITVDYEIL
ncbi:MAG: septal ring lytic transglycosylase RlpA family protein [Weeksellaceae bacterium]|nr:septal ring lytic transglycosylase RlpA family protein [Weeksellaceae bacterium]